MPDKCERPRRLAAVHSRLRHSAARSRWQPASRDAASSKDDASGVYDARIVLQESESRRYVGAGSVVVGRAHDDDDAAQQTHDEAAKRCRIKARYRRDDELRRKIEEDYMLLSYAYQQS